MEINVAQIISNIFWPMYRMAGLFFCVPIFNNLYLPVRLKVALVFLFGVLCLFLSIRVPDASPISILSIPFVVQEVFLGLVIAFILQITFQIFIIAGELISHQSGLGFGSLIMPNTSLSSPVIGHFYFLLSAVIFLLLDGHLLVLKLIVNSFDTFPIAEDLSLKPWLIAILNYSASMISSGFTIAFPLILSLLTVNLSFAIVSRSQPQMNLISIGFPLMLLIGIYLIYLTIGTVSNEVTKSLSSLVVVFKEVGLK